MHIFRRTASRLAIFFLGITLNCFAQNERPDPIIDPDGLQKITEHVYVIPDNDVPGVPNVGIIVGSKAILIVDTGMGGKNGNIVFSQAKKLANNNQSFYLVTTHIHPEHDLGAHALPASVAMIRASTQVDEIQQEGYRVADIFRSRSAAIKELLEGAEFRKADITFENNYRLDLGDISVDIMALGPNHTAGDTVVWVETDSVLFSGDIVMQAAPAFASTKSSMRNWQASLQSLKNLHAKIIVPSHGATGDAQLIDIYEDYLTSVATGTRGLKQQGKTLEDIQKTLPEQLSSPLASSPRIGGAISAAFRE